MFGDEKSSISLLKITPVLFPRTLLPKLKSQNFDLFLIQMNTNVISRCAFCFRRTIWQWQTINICTSWSTHTSICKKVLTRKNVESTEDGLQISRSRVFDITLRSAGLRWRGARSITAWGPKLKIHLNKWTTFKLQIVWRYVTTIKHTEFPKCETPDPK